MVCIVFQFLHDSVPVDMLSNLSPGTGEDRGGLIVYHSELLVQPGSSCRCVTVHVPKPFG